MATEIIATGRVREHNTLWWLEDDDVKKPAVARLLMGEGRPDWGKYKGRTLAIVLLPEEKEEPRPYVVAAMNPAMA